MRAKTTARAIATSALCLVLSTGSLVPTSPAFAQNNQKEAGNRFTRGMELFKEGDFEAALIEFKRAYELAPNFRVLYNIGQVQYQLQDYAGALGSFSQYLEEGGNKIPAARRKDVEKDLDKLRSRVAKVEITTNVPGAEITVDDVAVGTSPLDEPVLVSAGRRAIAASKEGRIPARKVVDVAGNDSMTVRLDLPEVTSNSPPLVYVEGEEAKDPEDPPPDDTVVDEPTSGPDIPWAWWAATGVFGVASGVFGAVALSSSSDLADMREDEPSTADDLQSASDRTTAFSVTTDVLIALTVITAGISTYLTIDAFSSTDDTAAGTGTTVRARVTPPVAPTRTGEATFGPPGLVIEGSF